ncbi:MAG: isocitrate lyase/PEP mutase family protein [Ilumatobacteraceae bacterium]
MSGRRLRALMEQGLVHAPGCFDALSATLVEQAGFDAAYLSGFALSAGSLGVPDLGLIGLDDVAGAVRRITAQVTIPVIADIDTGFGGPLNVRRTVLEVEAAGAAAVQIEDQVAPKRCGHFEDKEIVALDDAVERVAIAVESRRSADTVVIARTDAVAVTGVDAAIERGTAFVAAGADVVFVEALEDADQLARVSAALAGTPLLYNAVEGGRSPLLDAPTLATHGVRILIHPVTLLLETIRAQRDALAALRAGRPATTETLATARQVVGADEAIAFHADHR